MDKFNLKSQIMSKKWIYSDGNRGDKLIDLIREAGGTIFVDPCPNPLTKTLDTFLRVFKR